MLKSYSLAWWPLSSHLYWKLGFPLQLPSVHLCSFLCIFKFRSEQMWLITPFAGGAPSNVLVAKEQIKQLGVELLMAFVQIGG